MLIASDYWAPPKDVEHEGAREGVLAGLAIADRHRKGSSARVRYAGA